MTAADTVEVDVELDGRTRSVGRLRRHAGRRGESATFEYADAWLGGPERFAIDPALPLGRGTFAPAPGRAVPAAIDDTAPDSWGRRLMQRAERHAATREGRRVRTLGAVDYLLGVSDESRLGALRLRLPGEAVHRASNTDGVPPLIDLGRLLDSTDRILRDEGTREVPQGRRCLQPGDLGGHHPDAGPRGRHPDSGHRPAAPGMRPALSSCCAKAPRSTVWTTGRPGAS